MDAPCKIQGSIHVFRLVNNMCPGKWVHIIKLGVSRIIRHLGWRNLFDSLSNEVISLSFIFYTITLSI